MSAVASKSREYRLYAQECWELISRPRGGCWDQGDVSTHSRCVDETGRASREAPNVPVVLRPVPRFRGSQALAATLMRTSESKGHWRLYDSSAVLNLKFLHELAAQR